MTKRGSTIIAATFILFLFMALIPAYNPVNAAASELFFSEYIEGSSYNKALEIYNGTGAAVDLAAGGYSIEMYFNGSLTAGLTIDLTGSMADGDVYVVSHSDASAGILAEADQTSGAGLFNGDDAILLLKGGVVIDSLGQIGVDPGTQWGTGDVSTQDNTLRRKESVCEGDTDGSDVFEPSLEWDGYAVDTIDGLGAHTANCSGTLTYTPIYDIQYTADPSGDSPLVGQAVTTEGIVTMVVYNGYFIEDPAGGAWNGLWVYDSSGPVVGDRVRITGTMAEYFDLTEMTTLTEFTILSSGNPIPGPEVLATGDVSQEMWEGVLVKVFNVVVIDDSLGNGEWTVSDGSGDVVIDDKGSYTYTPVTGDGLISITGPLDFTYGAFKIQPRDDGDLVIPIDYTSIYDIQYTTDPSGDSPLVSQVVTTEGIVTMVLYNGFYIEDPAGGAWNGLWVYDSSGPAVGDRVRITGTVVEYNNLTEMTPLTEFMVLTSGNPVPDPVVLATGDVSQEMWEGVLVQVQNVTVTDENLGYGEWSVSDGSGDVVIDDKGSYGYVPTNGDFLVALSGPLDFGYGAFKIQPRDDGDIVKQTLVINEFLADPAPDLAGDANGDGTRNGSQDEFVEIVNISSDDVDVSGWTLSDEYSVRHEFAAGSIIPAKCNMVIFGGGTPTGSFGGAVIQTASGGYLGLNNDGDSISLSNGVVVMATVSYGAEGGENQSLTRDPDIDGEFVLHSLAAGGDGALFSPGTMVDGTKFLGCNTAVFGACGEAATPIHILQGDGDASPLDGITNVTIEGVVVGDFQGSTELRGFYLQEEDWDADDDSATSEGVYVYEYNPTLDVNMGDIVRLQGAVREYYDLTEVRNLSNIEICPGTAVASPGVVGLPVAASSDFEPVEGMRVTFPQLLTISEYYYFGRYGELVLTADRQFQPTAVYDPGSPEAAALAAANALGQITLDDGRNLSNPDPAIHPNGFEFTLDNLFRGGDQVQNLTGVVDYNYGEYKIHATQGATYIPVNLRTEQPDDVGSELKVASFNVLNYFTTLGSRGADTAEEFVRQRTKIFAALASIDADVVGLIEIENNGDALADLVTGLNELVGEGTYAAVETGVIGVDEITVAFIYKPGTVTKVGGYAVLDTPAFTDPMEYGEQKSRPALAQSFMDNATGGVFTAVVNHFKSKGSECDGGALGDDDPEAGSCNLTRTMGAQELAAWLMTDPTGSGDSDFLIIGDLNAYDKEDPIDALLAAGYTDLVDDYLGEFAYSYVFDGQLGYLDHALANPGLLDEVTGVTVWHINTDEPSLIDYDMTYKEEAQDEIYAPDPYRSSDHDPVIAGLDVCDEIPPTADVTLSREILWPPNHKLVNVKTWVEAMDNFDNHPTYTLVSVTSNEPDDGYVKDDAEDLDGKGAEKGDDWGGRDKGDDIVILSATRFKLRAERLGTGDGRIYTITYEIMDACGNTSLVSVEVLVPHSQPE